MFVYRPPQNNNKAEIEGNPESKTNDIATVEFIIRKYQKHLSIINIKSKNTVNNTVTHLTFQQQLQSKLTKL